MKGMNAIGALALVVGLSLGFGGLAEARVVTCLNCSERGLMALQDVRTAQEFNQLLRTYDEAVQQTKHQLNLWMNNIDQYKQMVKNATTLPKAILDRFNTELSDLASMSDDLRTLKGDYMATAQYFDMVYPGYDALKALMGPDSNLSLKDFWETWTRDADQAIQDTFKMTGYQLHDLVSNSGELEEYINNELLKDDLTEVQTLQSANKLASIQIEEARKMRMLMATSIQTANQVAKTDAKNDQLTKGTSDNLMGTGPLEEMYKGYYKD